MSKTELIVGQIIPDTTAITAFHALEKVGYTDLVKLKRERYYRFDAIEPFDSFSKKIKKVDILVNANKDIPLVKHPEDKLSEEQTDRAFNVKVLVTDSDDSGEGLLKVLQERLGFGQIKKLEKGILWTLSISAPSEKDAKTKAEEIAKKLLYNENYQECRIF